MDEQVEETKRNIGKLRKEWNEGYTKNADYAFGYVDGLIKKVQKLEKDKAEWEIEAHTQKAKNKRLEQQNKRYKEALKFYANEINYHVFIENGKSNIEHDGGKRARQNLKGEYL